jgi:hypothetical protein
MINDADIETADLQARANHESRLRKKGICAHGWIKTFDNGAVLCLDCQKSFPDRETMEEERKEILE